MPTSRCSASALLTWRPAPTSMRFRAQVAELFQQRDQTWHLPPLEQIRPITPVDLAAERSRFQGLGEAALQRGEVAVMVVAGGQGTRLGATQPKGMFPVGPVSGKSLF